MNVRLCAQTFHDKTADSFLDCEFKTKLKDFQGSIYTAVAFKVYHRIFRIFNSMHDSDEGWKSPVSNENLKETLSFIDSAEKFIRSLRLENGKSVLQSKVKTGFVGVIVGIEVMRKLCFEFIETKQWTNLKMYSTSQDHIEIFFGFVRLRLGCNDNPDAYLLECVYKSILGLKAMHVTSNGNCELQAHESELSSSLVKFKMHNIGFSVDKTWKMINDDPVKNVVGRTRKALKAPKISLEDSEIFEREAIKITATLVQQEVMSDIDCERCQENLKQILVSNGVDLFQDVLDIGRKSEFLIKLVKSAENFAKKQLVVKIMAMMDSNVLCELCGDHSHGHEDFLEGYRFGLVKKLIVNFIEKRACDRFKRQSDNLHDDFVRQRNKKLTLFSNQ